MALIAAVPRAPIFARWPMVWRLCGRWPSKWTPSVRAFRRFYKGKVEFSLNQIGKTGWQRADTLAGYDLLTEHTGKWLRPSLCHQSKTAWSTQLMPTCRISCDGLQHHLRRSTKAPSSKEGSLQKYTFVPLLPQSLSMSDPTTSLSTCLNSGPKEG